MDRESILKQWAIQALNEKPYYDPRFPPSPYYRFLRIAARNMQPGLSVELGVCGGGGSFHLATGWPNGVTIGVDVADDHRENIDFIRKECPNFRFWVKDSVEASTEIYLEYGFINILFIDTVHTLEQSLAEYNAYRRYMAKDFIICFDDLFRKEMAGLWEQLPGPKLRLDQLHDGSECGGGFGVIWGQG